MTPLEYRTGLSLNFKLASFGALCLAVGLLRLDEDGVVGWLLAVFGGLCLLPVLKRLVDRRPRLIVNDSGIHDRTLTSRPIPWGEIVDVEVGHMGVLWLGLQLRNPEDYRRYLRWGRRLLSPLNRRTSVGDFSVNLSGLSPNPDEVVLRVLEQIDQWPEDTTDEI